MSFPSALYTLLIGPLELFFEVLFSMANRVINNPGLSIIFLSLAMNFLVLPLYKMADAMQADAQDVENKLAPVVAHIKKTFTGDERYMILQTYYRQNNYKPTDALKGSVSLLLEIPFFMAAYNFLSGLPLLQGASLGPIQDLGMPDHMLVLGSIAINILPILMTAINLISSAIYTKGSSFKSKLQLYVMAGLFLVLLYDSPSGLVFYWTLNNLFSLAKNIFMKLKNPQKIFCYMVSIIGVFALAAVVVLHPMPTKRSQFLLCCLTLMLQLPLIIYFIRKHLPVKSAPALTKQDHMTFWIGGLFLTVLTGMFIPSGVISASPEEFLNPVTRTNPLVYILSTTLTAAGFFLVWFNIFYMLAKDSGKKWMNYGICAMSAIALVDFMCFGKDYGTLSPKLVFDISPSYRNKFLNIIALFILATLIFVIWFKRKNILKFSILTLLLSSIVISAVHINQIQQVVENKIAKLEQTIEDEPVISLSSHGKNVMILMLDRGIGAYVPYLMHEKPELKNQFAGFTYYPNTISFGPCTNIGSPALFGGYEYTPAELTHRKQESLGKKHNEALKVLPVIFNQANYDVTVCDAPYAGYSWVPDLSIYDEYPQIKKFNSMYRSDISSNNQDTLGNITSHRNLFCYSIFKVSPVVIQPYLYDGGKYHSYSNTNGQVVIDSSHASGTNHTFKRAYSVLQNLEAMTVINSNPWNTFLMLTNDTTHEPTLLQEPEYIPAEIVDNTSYDSKYHDHFVLNDKLLKLENSFQLCHYQVNMAAFLKLGEYFDFMRENHVFDNTRIIIVSDHGGSLHNFDNTTLYTEQGDQDILNYNPMLLVKDFNSTEFSVDQRFMTNADTPSLALQSLIQNPVNPFTGNPISNHLKLFGPQMVFCSHEFDIRKNGGNTFIPGPWYSVHDDIFDLDNWEYLGVY